MVTPHHRRRTTLPTAAVSFLHIPAARLKPLLSQMHPYPMLRGTWLCRCAPRAAWEHTRRAAVEPSRRSMPRSASVDTIVLRSRCRRRERRARIRAVFINWWASFPLFPVAEPSTARRELELTNVAGLLARYHMPPTSAPRRRVTTPPRPPPASSRSTSLSATSASAQRPTTRLRCPHASSPPATKSR